VKRWLDRGFDPDQEGEEKAPVEPVRVEPLEIGRERSSYAWPALIALFVVFALGAAMLNHFTSEPATPTPTPPAPTPIAWVDTTAAPAASAVPDETIADGSAAASSSPPAPIILGASIEMESVLWSRGTPNHFTLDLVNPTATVIPMSPCPAYRMYLTGIDNSTAPVRLLNCAAIGLGLLPGQSISLDMVYTPAMDDPTETERLVWQWVAPGTVEAIAIHVVSIEP